MKPELQDLSWPLERLGEGLQALARAAGLQPRAAATDLPQQLPAAVQRGPLDELDRWLLWASARLGLETEAVSTPVPQFEDILQQGGPAVLHIHHPELGRRFVLLLQGGSRQLRVIAPDLRVRRCATETLRSAVCAAHETRLLPEIQRLLDAARIPAERHAAVRRVMLAERLADARVEGCWILRLAATSHFWQQLRSARLPQQLGWILALFAGIYALEIAGWKLIGEAALDGRLDLGWLAAWVLLLLSIVPLRALSSWMDASFALQGGRLLKQRLLAGAMRLDLDVVRHLGAGQMLGRVMESQALEGLALSGGVGVIVATLELAFAVWILSAGAAGVLHLALLAGWLLLAAALVWRLLVAQRRWTEQRLDLTNGMVERMVGHRSSLAQERPERRDAADDATLQAYLQTSQQMDRALTPIVTGVPSGWMLLALAGLAPAFVGSTATPAALAISLGGMLFAHRALNGICHGVATLSRAALAWERVAAIFRAGAVPPAASHEPYISAEQLRAVPAMQAAGGSPLVEASQLVFGYREGQEPVLRGVDLRIQPGERILLQGPSGGGKSTLAALLVGLRRPKNGLLLLGGLDRHTLGDSWHAMATEAPQFHENHVLTGTLGFNLLMGRAWPASAADLAEAQALCEELGLGPLIARMPAGLQQRVGETGWQLSHGEKSRIFLARALLQKAPLTILDESFAALDPQTLKRCLDTALKRSQALIVIAHP